MPFFGGQFSRIFTGTQTRWYTGVGMSELGKVLIVVGVVVVIAGVLLTVLGRMNLPLGRLPGDIVYRGKNTTFYFPLATSILLSVVLSIVLYVVGRWKR